MRKLIEMNNCTRLKVVIFTLIGFYFGFSVKAQESTGQKEKVSFSTPKTLYFTGEKIWIEAEVLLGESPSTSQVLYAELVDRHSNSVDYIKMPLVQGKALNYFLIKPTLPSANYLLRIYTRISPFLDQNLGMAQQLVTILNPSIPPSAISDQVETQKLPAVKEEKSFPKSQKIIFEPIAPSGSIQSTGFSIANPYLQNEQEQLVSSTIYQSIQEKELLPELFGHVVEVKIPEKNSNSTYFLSVHGTQSALFTDIPDEDGRLLFDIGGLKHWDRMIVQLEDGSEMPGIEIVQPVVKTTFKSGFEFPILSLKEEDLPKLEKLLKASQIETYYQEEFFRDSMAVVTGFVADHTYYLDDYVRFDDVETVLKEYVPSVVVRTRNRKKEFRLADQAIKAMFDSNPLILVDAMPVFDSDLLASFNPKFMKRLEVLNREFYLNERTYPGVLSWSSYENNFGLFPLAPSARFFDYLGLQPKVVLDRSQFNSSSGEGNFPDWRTILFWNKTSQGIESILAPDVDGLFVYWVRSQDSQGKIQVQKRYFSILP